MATSAITSTGNSVINGDVSLNPGTSMTGFPPAVVNGAIHINDTVSVQARNDLLAGRSAAESRSWHRVYVLGGWEWDDTTSIMLRAWRRLLENVSTDDNPDIADFLGNGDLVVRWEPVDHSQSVALLLRNNFQRSNNRGFAQIDWATPVKFGNAGRTHLQISSGYGNGLLDYNHQQNTVGVGVSFREW
jgi:phospholipase A1